MGSLEIKFTVAISEIKKQLIFGLKTKNIIVIQGRLGICDHGNLRSL